MSEPLHDIDKLFFDNIEEHTEYPPKKVWDKIEAGLDKKSAVIYKKKYENIKRAALILILLITGILLYEIITSRHFKSDVAGNSRTEDVNQNKNAGNKNVNLQPDNEGTGNLTTQNENSHALPGEETIPLPVRQDRGIKNQKENVDISTVAVQKEKKLNSQKDTRIEETIKKDTVTGSAKNKTNQNIQGSDLHGIQTADLTDAKKIKKIPENKNAANNLTLHPVTGDNVSKNNVLPNSKEEVAKQNVPSSPIVNEKKGQSAAVIDEKNSGLSALSKIAGTIPGTDTAFNTNTKSNRQDIYGMKATAKQSSPSSKKITKINSGKPGLSLLFLFSPNMVWNSLENDMPHRAGGGGNHIDDHNAIKHSERHNLSYTGGVKLNYGLNKKWSVQSGMNYTITSSKIGSKLIFADRDNNGNISFRLDCSSGYSFLLPENAQNPSAGDSLMVDDTRNTLMYMGVPLEFEYKISPGKFSISALAGGQANILLKGKTTTVFGKGTASETSASGNTQALKSTYFSTQAGIKTEYRLNKKIALTIMPSGQFGLTSINKGASVKTRSNYFSVAAGLKIKL